MPGQVISYKKAIKEWKLYCFVIPSIVMIGTFSYFPTLSAVYHSFFDWQGGDDKQYIGLENFVRVFHDRVLWDSFITVGILVVANVVKLIPSILMAVLIHRLISDRWQYWYRVIIVLPMVVPHMVTLLIWKFFFDPNLGVLNAVLDHTGVKALLVMLDHKFGWDLFVEGIPIPWLSQPRLIIPSLILWGFPWIGGMSVLIYLSGLQSIGSDVYEAADLDGASGFQKLIFIEVPLILTQVRLMLILLVINTLQGYGFQYLLLGENGGAGGRGMVPGLWMFNRGFSAGEFGYACAIGLVLFVFILLLTHINNKYVRVQK